MRLRLAETGVVVMHYSTGYVLSQEGDEWGKGAFTKATLEGFKGPADMDRNIAITLKELTDGRQYHNDPGVKVHAEFPVL